MPDLRALLAALGGGAESLGSDIGQRDQLALVRKRQAALDAMQRLQIFDKLGLSDVPQGQDPNAFVQKQNDYNDMVSGVGTAIPSGAGPLEPQGPSSYGKVRTMQLPDAQGNLQTVIQDPSKTPEALMERRQSLQQLEMDKRAQQAQSAASALQAQKDAAKAAEAKDAGISKARATYTMLQTFDPKVLQNFGGDKLIKQPFDPEQADNYDKALALAGQLKVQREAYHAPPMMWEETSSVGPHGRVMLMDRSTGQRMEAPEGTPKQPGGAGTGQGALTSLPDLLRTHDAMSKDENDPQFEMTRAAQATEGGNYGVQHAFVKGTSPGVGNLVAAAAGQVMGGASDRQVNYLKNARSWGEDVSQAWKGRTNEERVLRDVATGSIDPSTTNNPVVKASLQTRRENAIAMTALANPVQFDAMAPADKERVKGFMQRLTPEQIAQARQAAQQAPQTAPQGGGGGGIDLRSTITPAERKALRDHGFSDAQINAKYGPP